MGKTIDINQIADEKRGLSLRICQEIREFEQKTGMQVMNIKINRDDEGLESVMIKVEIVE